MPTAKPQSAINQHRLDKHLFAYELDIARLESEGRIAPGSIKGIGVPGIAAAQKWLGSSVPQEFKLGIVTALLQMLALRFAMKDLANNDQFNEEETRVKAILAAVSLGATIVETVAVSVEKSVEHPLGAFVRSQWVASGRLAGKIAKGARFVGMLAGIFAGAYDIAFNGLAAFKDDRKLLGWLYVASGALGIGIAIAGYFSLGAIFWPFFISSFLLAIAIALVNKSALKTWIAHCEFSLGERYTSFDSQLKGYHEAVGD